MYVWVKPENQEEKVLYSKIKRNQPDRCRFYNADMEKYVAFILF